MLTGPPPKFHGTRDNLSIKAFPPGSRSKYAWALSMRGHRASPRRDRLPVTLEHVSFSLYDKHVVTEEQIQHWVDEAEAGYDVDELKQRGRGRPGRGAEPMQVVAVRLTAKELDSLDAAAAKNDMSRSEAIRAALAHLGA
jgi:hypothetical protein